MKKATTKAKIRRYLKFENLLIILAVCFIILLVLLSPLFKVKEIEVSGNDKYSKEEICQKIGAATDINIFSFDYNNAKRILEKDAYIKSYSINSVLPDKINIEIVERKIRGYVPYMGAYLYIDEDGRVLESQKYYKEKLPIVVGLKFEEFKFGELLPVENIEELDIVVSLTKLMIKYDLLNNVIKVDVSNLNEIHLYINKVNVLFGNMTDADIKVSLLTEIIKEIRVDYRGILDISDMSINPHFELLK